MLVNIVAVVWGVGMALNLAWPREAVYGEGWYNAWGAFIYIGVILGFGLLVVRGQGPPPHRHAGLPCRREGGVKSDV